MTEKGTSKTRDFRSAHDDLALIESVLHYSRILGACRTLESAATKLAARPIIRHFLDQLRTTIGLLKRQILVYRIPLSLSESKDSHVDAIAAQSPIGS